MSKTKIRIISVGHLPADFDLVKIEYWKSKVFDIVGDIENYELRADSDGYDWEYSDSVISTQLPERGSEDFTVVLVGVPLEDNWYTRRVSENTVVLTFRGISNYLRQRNIPIENVVLRLLYAYTLVYQRNGNRIPSISETTNFTHDETRGCIFDMNGIKEDIVYSCDKPTICNECQERAIKERVSNTTIKISLIELAGIRKLLFYRMADWVKIHPVISIVLSSLWAVVLGVVATGLSK